MIRYIYPWWLLATQTELTGHWNLSQIDEHFKIPSSSGWHEATWWQSLSPVQSGIDGFSHTDFNGFQANVSLQWHAGFEFASRRHSSFIPQATDWHGLIQSFTPFGPIVQIDPYLQSELLSQMSGCLTRSLSLTGWHPMLKSFGFPA